MAHCSYTTTSASTPPGWVGDGEGALVPRACPRSQLKQTGPTVNPNWCEASPL